MSRHLVSEQISAWIAGERTPDAQLHMDECAQCRAEVSRLDDAFAQFRDSACRWSEQCYAAPPVSRPRIRIRLAAALALAAITCILVIQRPAVTAEEPFIEIPYSAPLAPYERTAVMRMDVQVTALIAAGLKVNAHDPSGAVTVDVLVGQDGRAHAFRPIDRSITQ